MLKGNCLQQLKSTYVRKYVVGVGCKEEGSVKAKKCGKHDNQFKLKRSSGKIKMAASIAFFPSIAYPFVIQYFLVPFALIMTFYNGISIINLNITNFMLLWQIKPCQVEKCDSSSDCSNSDPAEPLDPVNAKKPSRRIRFLFCRTFHVFWSQSCAWKSGQRCVVIEMDPCLWYHIRYWGILFNWGRRATNGLGTWKQLSHSGFCSKGTLFSKLSSQNWQCNFKNNGRETLQNRTYRNKSLVHASFCINHISPIVSRWKLVKHLDCFGDNRRTKDTRKIKLCSLDSALHELS